MPLLNSQAALCRIVACAFLWSIGGALTAFAEEPTPDDFPTAIRPLVETHCFKCHNEKKTKGGVDLTGFTTEESVLKGHKLWRKVIELIETEEMPPDDDKFTPEIAAGIVGGLKKRMTLLETGSPRLLDAGPALIRRLSHVEYSNAFRDLTGYEQDLARQIGLPADSTGSSYENIAGALQMPPALLEKYFAGADLVLDRLFGPLPTAPKVKPRWMSPNEVEKLKAQQAKFFAELPENADRATATRFIASFTRRAWRRPVAADETERLMKIFDAALAASETPRHAVRRVLKPILVAPDFLFRFEDNQPATAVTVTAGSPTPAARVSPIEMASRLSFFLWSSIPDEELLTLAENGQLAQEKVLEAQVKRMLADPKARELTENFFVRWLGADHVMQARPSTEFYPLFNDALKKAMLAEVVAFCDNLRTEDRPVLEFLRADYTFANADLAKLYGLEEGAVSGKELQRVALKPELHRGGVLGMGAILAGTSHTDRTSPTQRGKWMLDVIFGTPPAPPPANASQFKSDKKKAEPKNFREKLAQHAEDATCAGCHRRMDPLGFGLDNFDAIGAWRQTTADLDTSGELPGGKKFNGVDELKAIVWEKRDQFTRNLVAQMLIYALGRELEYFDENQVSRIKAGLDGEGTRFSALVLGIVRSYPFQYRRMAEPAPAVAAAAAISP